MAKKFKELRDKMSPESKKRVARRVGRSLRMPTWTEERKKIRLYTAQILMVLNNRQAVAADELCNCLLANYRGNKERESGFILAALNILFDRGRVRATETRMKNKKAETFLSFVDPILWR